MGSSDESLKKSKELAEKAVQLHQFYRGKVQMTLKCPVRDFSDFAVWYTPGVAAPCREIEQHRELVYSHTNKANSIAIVSDGTRVLGLGDIGPEAGLPVMEGKALLFKYLGGVDAVPICLDTKDPHEFVRTVRILQPSFGGINLEDISQPKCFAILDQLRAQMDIPVWHDDQQGSATVLLAGLRNALTIVGKSLEKVKIAMIGVGAANIATYRLLLASGVNPAAVVACDSKGTLHLQRDDIKQRQNEFSDKWRICAETNIEVIDGGIADALRGADVCISFAAPGPNLIRPEWIASMANDAIVFACANPIPEIWPGEAKAAGARIVATGRGDFPNQVNNSMGFPGIFRGALDVRASTITDEMALAAASQLAAFAEVKGLCEDRIVPRMDEWEVFPQVAVATAMKAQEQGVASLVRTEEQLHRDATEIIRQARDVTHTLMRDGLITEPAL